jgi:arylsulfatase A-like enzyme
VIDAPVDLADLAPTLRDAAGLARVVPCDGESLLSRVRDERFDETFWADVSSWGRERAMRIGAMKLLTRPPQLPENAIRRAVRPVAWELYDLESDPGERHNLLPASVDASSLVEREDLLPAFRAIARRFEAELAEWRERGHSLVADPSRIETSHAEEIKQRLRELGYVEDEGPDSSEE